MNIHLNILGINSRIRKIMKRKVLISISFTLFGMAIIHACSSAVYQKGDVQLTKIEDLICDLKKVTTDEDKAKITAQIKAHSELFTKNNSSLLNELLSEYLK